jgi:predicted enzyme related to lactoylglutathione lyase
MSQINPVGWFEIYTEDIKRAAIFYKTVLGSSFEDMTDPTNSGMQMKSFPSNMTSYGAPGALVKMDDFQPGVGGTLIYFAVEDCATEESQVVAAGGEVIQSKQALGEFGFMGLCKDTEGNMFGLHSMK